MKLKLEKHSLEKTFLALLWQNYLEIVTVILKE